MIDLSASDFERRRTSGSLKSAVLASSRIAAALAPPLLLFLVTLPAFLPILGNGFVAWDDDQNFVTNPSYRGLGLSNLSWACTTFHLGVYQPLAWMLFGLEYSACGMNPRLPFDESHPPRVGRRVSLSLDGQAAGALPARSGQPGDQTCLVAATVLFLVHPLRVEAVAWASCQGYLPCAWFFILAVMAYERSRPAGLPERDGCFLAALFNLRRGAAVQGCCNRASPGPDRA